MNTDITITIPTAFYEAQRRSYGSVGHRVIKTIGTNTTVRLSPLAAERLNDATLTALVALHADAHSDDAATRRSARVTARSAYRTLNALRIARHASDPIDAAAHPIDALEATEYAFCIIHEAPMHAGDRSCMHHRSAFEACTSVRMYIDADELRAGRAARRTVNALADR